MRRHEGLFFEQFVGGAAVLVDGGHMGLDPGNFLAQDGDALGQFVLTDRSEILFD